ncbi:ABC transporter ATP-binding protein, partial [Mesorhizobium sp. M2D.F.Ca.ET.160.01.1.1]
MLELRNVTKTIGAQEHIRDVSLTLQHGSLNVLLGPTLSGKTRHQPHQAGLA